MMSGSDTELRAGDWVQVCSPEEIAQTLDENGMLDGLPFMPEMMEWCGKKARVARRAEKTCIEYAGGNYKIREFVNDNTVVLEGLRCSGKEHGGCQRACLLFWKTSWLRKTQGDVTVIADDGSKSDDLRAKLKTMASPTRYICQSTELARATRPFTRASMLFKCLLDIQSGGRGVFEMAKLVLVPLWRKATRRFRRRGLTGNLSRTPVGDLALQPGDWVRIKPNSQIVKTLDGRGRNRGLIWDYGMDHHGKQVFQVRTRLDRMISEVNGEMRRVEATVILEGLTCMCSNVLGGCPRLDYTYWREVWLERVNAEERATVRANMDSVENLRCEQKT
jgi:hypothetical protein